MARFDGVHAGSEAIWVTVGGTLSILFSADTDQATPSHADGVESIPASVDTCNACEVCLLQPREGMALVSCGHLRFCGSCADTVASLDRGCPIYIV